MLRNRILILLGVCFLAGSASWADEVGYVDCSKNADATQVFGKPRKSPDVVASLPCGERFTILVYGFYFSRIQTKDGQVGYIFSSLIVQDRGATSLQPAASTPQTAQPTGQQTPVLQTAAEKTKIPRPAPFDAQPKATEAAQVSPAAAQPVATQPADSQPVAVPPAAAAPVAVQAAPVPAANVADTVSAKPELNPSAPADVQPAPIQPGTSSPAGFTTPATTSPAAVSTPSVAETAPTAAEINPPAAAQPQPAEAQPAPAQPAATPPPAAQPTPAQPAPAIRPADTRESWEKPRPSVRTAPLIELYGGYAFARLAGGGSGSNMNGALGSFGWNVKSWVQVSGDTSYSFVTAGNTKSVIYGNHYGPRFFLRLRNRWGVTPFAEALVGGSRSDVTVSGTGGYSSSQNTISYKAGGGVDFHPSHRWEIRLFDFDYYRTAFGTNAHQNDYWISTGVVLRLFGGGSE